MSGKICSGNFSTLYFFPEKLQKFLRQKQHILGKAPVYTVLTYGQSIENKIECASITPDQRSRIPFYFSRRLTVSRKRKKEGKKKQEEEEERAIVSRVSIRCCYSTTVHIRKKKEKKKENMGRRKFAGAAALFPNFFPVKRCLEKKKVHFLSEGEKSRENHVVRKWRFFACGGKNHSPSPSLSP